MNKFKGFIKLSQEQYDTLKEQGSIEVKGKTFTYDPDNTIYIVKGESVQFTQEDQTKVNTIDISGDGSKFLSDDGVYKEIEGGVETLVGTDEHPINFSRDVLFGKLYLISGKAICREDSFYTFDVPTLVMRTTKTTTYDTQAYFTLYNTRLSGSQVWESAGEISTLTVYSESGYMHSTDTFTHISALNGKSGTVEHIYAATTSGTTGQILQSRGGSKAPTWIDMTIQSLVGTAEKPINLATDLEVGKIYVLSGSIYRRNASDVVPLSPVLVIKVNNDEATFFGYSFDDYSNGLAPGTTSYVRFDTTTGYVRAESGKHFTYQGANGRTSSVADIYVPTIGGTAGQILQSNGNSEPKWVDMPPTGPEYLNGTAEAPINLYNDLEVNKLYLISGIIYNSEDNLTANDSILTYKTSTNSLYLIGGKIDLITNELSFQPNYFTVAEVEATGEISTHQSSIAPVNSGTSGQVLTSNGPDQEPTWEDVSTSNNPNTSALTADGAELNFNAGDSTGTAHLVCNQNLYIGEETKDLSLDCDTFQLFTQDGWNWESTITDENGDDDTARFSFQMGNITLSNSNQGIHLNKATDQIILQASSVRGNTSTADLGTSDLPWNNIYGKTIYQNGQQVATKAEAALYKHNVSINGSNDSGQQINARVVGLNRSNVLVTTYGQLINMITGAVDYPLSGYVYNEDNTFLGTILYFDYNMGNYFEFTVATPTGIEVIQLTTAQATISDTVAVVE